ncbi:MAG: polysaccharide deacetylase family protein [Candidatus Heimdallarchaeota archaeon]|nr:polysaccharide deacetylase family protein [Candidatus Heimdallarchaeota archaeon]
MPVSRFIEELGFSISDKVVIFHIDDIGFSHAANVGSFECLDKGVASCGSIIVPAPWFLDAASTIKQRPHYDIGVHLTLTAEYETYRWRALSSVNPSSGLLSNDLCLWKTSEEAVEHISQEAAEQEMRAQIDYAIQSGIDITHIDSHMGTVINPKFLPSYLSLAREYKIPAFFPRLNSEEISALGFGEYTEIFLNLIDTLEAEGFPLMDQMIIDTGGEYPDKVQYYCERFKKIKPGLTHFLFHPAKMNPELQSITPKTAKWRNQDYEAFTNPLIRQCVEEFDLHVIGYREIREVFRNRK